MFWDVSAQDRVMGYASLDEQFLDVDAYTETTTSNPFPASFDAGTVRMDIARTGGAWTHAFTLGEVPVDMTLSGSMAYAYSGESGMRMTVAGIGALEPAYKTSLWGEFGASVAGQLADSTTLTLGINGTAGGKGIGTSLHGGMGLSYKF